MIIRILACAAALLFGLVGPAGAQMLDRKVLSLTEAKQIAEAAQAEATKNKFNMAICIVDEGGRLIYFESMDDTQKGSIDVAIAKARTAFLFRRPSKAFEDVVASGRVGYLDLPGAIPIEGGVPLVADGKVVGAIGVSGGTSAQDGQVAQAGASVLH